jgi:hypothetical protein
MLQFGQITTWLAILVMGGALLGRIGLMQGQLAEMPMTGYKAHAVRESRTAGRSNLS